MDEARSPVVCDDSTMTIQASYTIDAAVAASGIPAFFIRLAISDGRLKAHDAAGAAIIAHADLAAFIDQLPSAKITSGRERGREIALQLRAGETRDPQRERGRQLALAAKGKKEKTR